ncbi:hypothetical protein [Nocardioides alcanivorans]|uniref:hypothetical protein n=1 Tax=Nocardioides alcanivorans TaxID=2897352 RepID=UPI001F1AC58F|nr:hypothetical protein [Nocardioides alcanivorans]
MKRKASQLSDATIRECREVTLTGQIIGDYPLPPDRHVLIVAVPADAEVEVT